MAMTNRTGVACGLAMSLTLAAGTAQAQRARQARLSATAEAVRVLAQAELEKLGPNADWPAVNRSLDELFLQTVVFSPERELDALVQVDAPRRLVEQLMRLPKPLRDKLTGPLLEHEKLGWTLAMLVEPGLDNVAGVYEIVSGLIDEHGIDTVVENRTLVSAIAVVHDREFTQQVNEYSTEAPEPGAIFKHYLEQRRRLAYDPAALPGELLIYAVDITQDPAQLEWALERYQRVGNLGDRYFDVEYDSEHFRSPGTAKRITEADEYNLEAILKYGGVCADQAYFAATVGKAKGQPTAYIWAQGANASHAWLGYLKRQGRRYTWDFDAGRYEAYKKIGGELINPQTGKTITDAELSLTADLTKRTETDRWVGQAVGSAVAALAAGGANLPADPPSGVEPKPRFTPRTAQTQDRLDLLEAGLAKSPASDEAWAALTRMVEAGELDEKQMDQWWRHIDKFAGSASPSFMVQLVSPMIRTETDLDEQSKLWGWLLGKVQRTRPDLASAILLEGGALNERAGKDAKAYESYKEIVDRYANEGAAVVEALERIEKLIRKAKGSSPKVIRADIVPVYETAFRTIRQPQSSGNVFLEQSNWHRVGTKLVSLYQQAGMTSQAQSTKSSLTGGEQLFELFQDEP